MNIGLHGPFGHATDEIRSGQEVFVSMAWGYESDADIKVANNSFAPVAGSL